MKNSQTSPTEYPEAQMHKSDEIWIPVGTPDHLNIPCLAMGTEWAKKSRVDRITKPEVMLSKINNRAAGWLIEREAKRFVSFYATREYLHPKTAVYQNWLVFRDSKSADDFLESFPELNLKKSEHRKEQNG